MKSLITLALLFCASLVFGDTALFGNFNGPLKMSDGLGGQWIWRTNNGNGTMILTNTTSGQAFKFHLDGAIDGVGQIRAASYTGDGSGLTNLAGSTLPGYVTTNGQPTALFKTNQIAYAITPLSVSGVTGVNSFLNSTNWQLYYPGGATNTIWAQFPGKTNFLWYDQTYNFSFVFANTVFLTNATRGPTGIVIDTVTSGSESVSIQDVINLDNGQWSPNSTLFLTNSQIGSSTRTNLQIGFDSVIVQQTESGGAAITVQTPLGSPLVQIDQDAGLGGGNYAGHIRMWGSSVGIPNHGLYNVLRLDGSDLNIIKYNPNEDPRVGAIWAKSADSSGTNGGALYLISRAPIPTSGTFNYGGYLDNLGNWSFGHNPSTIDSGNIWHSPAEVNFVGSTVTNLPQLLLSAGLSYIGNSNGAIWSDGTNIWVVQNGVAGKIASSTSSANLPSDLGTNTTQEGATIYGDKNKTNSTTFGPFGDTKTNNGTGNSVALAGNAVTVANSNQLIQARFTLTSTGATLVAWSASGTNTINQPTNGPTTFSGGASFNGTISGNGAGLTNQPYAKTFASTNGYFSFALNSDGSTNVTFTITNLAYQYLNTNGWTTAANVLAYTNGVWQFIPMASGGAGGGGNVVSNSPVAFNQIGTNGVLVGIPGTNNNTGLEINSGALNPSPNNTNSTAYYIGNRRLASLNTYPVGAIFPVNVSNSPMALDIMPAPGTLDIANGNNVMVDWIDLCSTNCITNQPPMSVLRIAKAGTALVTSIDYIGTAGYNGGTAAILKLGYNDTVALTMNSTPGIQVNGGLYNNGGSGDIGFNGGAWASFYVLNAAGKAIFFGPSADSKILYESSGVFSYYMNTNKFSGVVIATNGFTAPSGGVFSGNGSGLTNIGNFYFVSTNSTQLTITNAQNCRGVFTVNIAFDDVTGGNPSCTVWETNSVFTNFFGTISPNLSGLTLVGTVSVTNFYSFPAQTNSTLTIVDTSSGGAAVRKIVGNIWY